MTNPTLKEERIFWNLGCQYVAGVDEVGRGCFAGPVVAAAVILAPGTRLHPASPLNDINDSKKLTAQKRKELDVVIRKRCVAYSIAEISVDVINQIGVGKASQQAFVKAVNGLSIKPDQILIDAFYINALSKHNQKPIINGDGLSITIAAASIIAKVYRDNLMQSLHDQYVNYDFLTNKGYGTKKHREAIRLYGLSDLHRTSFHLEKFL